MENSSTFNQYQCSEGPFGFFDLMSRNRFDVILQSLVYTNENPPTRKD